MAIRLSPDQALKLRVHAQRLTLRPRKASTSVARLVKELCGIQAQELPSAALAIRARSQGLVAADVQQSREQERTIVRTWGMRGTLHLLATEDLGWLLALLGPVFIEAGSRRRAALGLDDDLYARCVLAIRDMLADQGSLTRAEIVDRLAGHGIRIEGQARPYLLARAALEGLICYGPERGAEPTYVLLQDWIGQELKGSILPESEAYTELSRRYLSAYGPATPKDQAAWSGLPLSKIKPSWHRIDGELMEVDLNGAPAWMLNSQAAWLDEIDGDAPIVRLLPRYDVYLLGYQKRDLAVSPQFAKRINAGGGIVHPVVLVDGRAAGIWKSEQKKGRLAVMLEPFDQLTPKIEEGLEAEVADLGRFQGLKTNLEIRK